MSSKTLFDPAVVAELQTRIARLRPDSARQWGKMTVTQAVEHLARGMEMAVGDLNLPRHPLGRLMGWAIKPLALGDDAPMRRNAPTMPELVVTDAGDLDAARARLSSLVDRFAAAGPGGCTTHPHSFFGRLTPREWAVLGYKHLDHHLRQFGV